ncbi:MAG: saccharopine dehydrogenase NADP-binding domain-containing protein [Deltaproteobacteria bacterium]|nr:MAG: saccharopine dehydrogenase NADP-binding domain-containing protein [Deltaproteobacteria bacterium]
MRITVLGAGLVGNAIVKDLAKDRHIHVTAIDKDDTALLKLKGEPRVEGVQADVQASANLRSLVADSDLVVSAVPGVIGFDTVRKVIEAGKNLVDISFFKQDPFLLDELAKAKGVTVIVDCGVAPGLCNIIAGHVGTRLDGIHRYICYVGGLPRERRWPFEYKALFSPADVLEEYTRPARFVESGKEAVRPALSDVEVIDFPNLGTLEAFNTDGLRTLRKTLNAPFMKEKTLRYPGHADLMRVFRESGFLDATPIEIDGHAIAPISLTSRLLFEQWKLEEGEEDFTVMHLIIEGSKGKKRYRCTFDLLDTYDRETQTTSMARTTGYTCTTVARQVLGGLFTRTGMSPPEFIGRTEGCYQNLLEEYAKRDIRLTETITEL